MTPEKNFFFTGTNVGITAEHWVDGVKLAQSAPVPHDGSEDGRLTAQLVAARDLTQRLAAWNLV